MHPAPTSASASNRPRSGHRLKIEYDGCEIRSGVPMARRMAAASLVCDRE
jgi:hypothetical protein